MRSKRCVSGYVDVMVAGGTESMSNAPYLLKGARWGYRMGHAKRSTRCSPRGSPARSTSCHMGITAEEIASRYGVSRADQDAFAAESQRRAAQAIQERQLQGGNRAGRRPAEEGRPAACRHR